jgi:hypothetical protein
VKYVHGEVTFKVKYRLRPECYDTGLTEAEMLDVDRQQADMDPIDFLEGMPSAGDVEIKLEIKEEK